VAAERKKNYLHAGPRWDKAGGEKNIFEGGSRKEEKGEKVVAGKSRLRLNKKI